MTDKSKSCADCRHPIHEQFKGYEGRWLCFKYPRATDKALICHTPKEDFGNDPESIKKHQDTLSKAPIPEWCPLKER